MHIQIFLQLNIPTCSTHRDLSKNALKSVTLWNTYKKLIFVEVGVEMVTLPAFCSVLWLVCGLKKEGVEMEG